MRRVSDPPFVHSPPHRAHERSDLGLVATLLWHLERYRAQTGIPVSFHHRGVGRFATETEITAFRIIQAALTNIARQAGVREATVELWSDGAMLHLSVEDEDSRVRYRGARRIRGGRDRYA
jgi:signal transduction histidine kinase